MAGLFYLEDMATKPLFLAGANLAMGGGPQGMMQGLSMGSQFQQRRKAEAEAAKRAAAYQGLFADPNVQKQYGNLLPLMQAAGPEDGLKMASTYALKQPELDLDRQRLAHTEKYNWAQLAEQKRNHDLQMQRMAADSYGKAGTIVQGGDGQFYSVQFGSNGKKIVEPLLAEGKPLTPAKGVDVVGDLAFDKATGRTVRNVGENLAGAEQAKVEGKVAGERTTGLPKAQAALVAADAKGDIVMKNLEEAEKLATGWTTGAAGAALSIVPGTPAFDMKERLKTVLANSGFDELQTMRDNSPTGGALGAIAVQELEMLQKIRGSLEQAQSLPQLRSVMQEYKEFMAGSRERRRTAFDSTFGGVSPAGTPAPVTRSGASGTAPKAAPGIPPDAVAELRKNTSLERRQQFDAIFGPGAAARALGGR